MQCYWWYGSETLTDGEYLNPATEFKILLATDIHLGHKYENIIRSNDTFDTFDEILEIAKNEKVDFVLLGGDLFDVNEPSLGIMNQAISILSKAGSQTRFLIGYQAKSDILIGWERHSVIIILKTLLSGVYSDGLKITAFPQAKAGAALNDAIWIG